MKRKTVLIALGVIGLSIIGGGIYLVLSNAPVRDIVELAAQGGSRELRSPMRANRSQQHVLVFALDGVGYEQFHEAVRSGKTPRIGDLFGREVDSGTFEHGYSVPDAASILPSTTMAAWSSIYTGEPPARTGVPGNEWFARDEMRFYAPAPVSVTENDHTVKMLTDGLVGNAIQTPTLFDLADLRAHVSLAPVYRGADLFTTPEPAAIADLFAEMAEGIVDEGDVSRESYSEVDQESIETLLDALDKHGIPDIQVVYFPGIDLYSHVATEPLIHQQEYLQQVLDSAIGQVLDAYRKRGALDATYVVFIADHGHTPTINDDRHSLSTEGEDEPPALIEKTGFRVRSFALEPDEDEQDYQATVAYQGAMAYIYLADRSSCPNEGDRCDWRRAPRLEEDVLPLARAFYNANESGEGLPELRGTLDLIFAREPRRVEEDALPFQIFDGQKLVPIREYLKGNPRPDLVRLEERMLGLAAGRYGHRAGDILLLSRSGLERPIEDRYYFSGLYRSWHGSPARQDSHIPFAVARAGDSGVRLRELVRKATGDKPSQLDMVPLVRALMQ